ncbi:MAG: crcB [Conexibacter sp.]|nr:crcB [Conexibacter sp.]
MSVAVVLGLGVLGGAGAAGRFLIDGAVARRVGSAFPFGTLAVNLAGALALGVLAGAGVGGDAYRLWAAGLIGAFTTFSTWMLETHRLAEEGQGGLAVLNVAVSLVLGVLAALLGRAVGGSL